MAAALDDYRWLVSEAAAPWLERLRAELLADGYGSLGEPRRGAILVSLLKRLRKELSAERAHLVVEQAELRQRAREKFANAERTFFTRIGLEQATDERLAAYKAARFVSGERDADLCCGIGGDLLALAARGPATGVDLDPVTAILAEANAAALGLANNTQVVVQDAASMPLAEFSAWHCDPDRRAVGTRTTRVESFAPSLETLDRLLATNGHAAIKLAPATDAPLAWEQVAELEWLGSRGECRQQVAWFGTLARNPGQRSATIVEGDGPPRTVIGSVQEFMPLAPALGRYLYEPHAAVLAAQLSGALCREYNLAAVSAGIAYLTSDGLIADAALAAFEITDVLPLDRKRLKAHCREQAIGRLEVKKRGLDIDPAKLRQEIIAKGDNAATLIVTPVAGQTRALFARRLP